MAVKAGTAFVDFEGDFSELNKQVSGHFNKLSKQAGDTGKKAGDALGGSMSKQASSHFAKLSQQAGDAGRKAGAALGGAMKLGIAGAGVAAGGLFMKGITDAIDAEKVNSKLAAQLGSSKATSKKMGKIAGKVYADAYGDSLGQVNDAIRGIVQNDIAKKTGKDVEGLTKKTLDLAAAFDVDVGDATRGVGQLLRTGLVKDANQAFDIIFKGFQKGGDKAGDLIDTLNEYSTQWRKLGINAKTATGLIVQGLKAGARDSDLVADSLKEFSIRALDGSKTTSDGFKRLGLDADAMAKKIGGGGKGAADGLDQVLDRLRKIQDPVKRSQVAVELFGTQAEDLGDALFALDPSKAVAALGKVDGAAKKAGDSLSDNVAAKFESLKRKTFQGFQGVAAKYVLPEFNKILTTLNDPKLTSSQKWDKIGQQLATAIDKAQPIIEKAIKGLTPVITDAFGAIAPVAARSFIDAFIEAPVWARLLAGAWLFKKLGGAKAFAAIGAAGAAAMSAGTAAGGAAAGGGAAKGAAKVAPKLGKLATIGSSAAAGSVGGPWGIAIAAGIGTAIAFSPEIAKGVGKALDAFTTSDGEKKGRKIAKDIAAGASSDPAIQAALQKKIDDTNAQIRAIEEGLVQTKIDPNTGVASRFIRPPTEEEKARLQAAYNTIGKATAEAYATGFNENKFWDESSLFVKFRDEVSKLPPQARQAAADSMVNFAHKLEENGHLPSGATAQIVNNIKTEFGLLPSYLSSTAKKGMDSITAQMQRRDATNAFRETAKSILSVFPTAVRQYDPAKSVGDNFRALQGDLRTIIKNGTPAAQAAARTQLQAIDSEYKKWGRRSVASYDEALQDLGIKGSKQFATLRGTILKDAAGIATGVKGSGDQLRTNLNTALKLAGQGGSKKAAAARTNIVNRFLESAEGVGNAGGKMGDAIGTSVGHAASSTYKGLSNVEGNLNRARKTLGLGEISFGLQPQGKKEAAAKAPKPAANPWQALPTVPFGAQSGSFVPGSGTGDKIAAMLEPGEYVLNKNVVKKVGKDRLDALNFQELPRFQAGGGVNWGGHPALTGPIARAVGMLLGHFPGLGVSSTTDHDRLTSSGNVSNHVMGLAADISGSPDIMLDASSWIGRLFGPSLLEGIHNPNLSWKNGARVAPSFWGGAWADHIDHIHMAMKALSAVLASVAGQTVKGPKGALSSIIQKSLDLTTGLANSSLEGALGGGDATSYGAGALTKSQLQSLWVRAGGDPGVSNLMAAIALAESGGIPTRNNADRPGDGGHHIAAGLWQILGLPFEGNVYDPLTNARMAVSKYSSQGLGAWEAYTNGGYRTYLQQGGLASLLGYKKGKFVSDYKRKNTKVPFTSKKTKKILDNLTASKPVRTDKVKSQRLSDSLASIGYDRSRFDGLVSSVDISADWADVAAGLTDTNAITDALQLELEKRLAVMTPQQKADLATITKDMLPTQKGEYISEAIFPAAAQAAIVDSMQGRVADMTQLQWLDRQLHEMLNLRNLILVDTPSVQSNLDTSITRIADAKALQARLEKEIADLEDEIDKFTDRRQAEMDERQRITDTIKSEKNDLETDERALEREKKKKKPNTKSLVASIARHTEHLDNLYRRYDILSGGSPGQIANAHDFGHNRPYKNKKWLSIRDYNIRLHQDRIDKNAFTRQKDTLVDTTIPALEDRKSNLETAKSDLADNLVSLQGAQKGGIFDSVLTLLPERGVLGRRFFEVQSRVADLTANPSRITAEIPDSSDTDAERDETRTKEILAELLRQSNLRYAVSQAQFDVFQGTPGIPFGGSFKEGGEVPGPVGAPRMILAHGGETVIPNDANYTPGVTLQFANGMEWLKQFVNIQVDSQTRTQSRRGERQLPGRAGTLR